MDTKFSEGLESMFQKGLRAGELKTQSKILEKLLEIKYRSHNPDKDCACDTCKIVSEISDLLRDPV